MPPRGNEGLDFTPILTHYLFLFTTILAVVGWFMAFIAQAVATAQFGHGSVGVMWFAIFLQLFLTLGVLQTLASDSIAMHRMQISTFGSVAIVFAVIGVNEGIFSPHAALDAMGAGWLILAIVDILWVLYFTSEEDSLTLHIFNSLGTGGLTPPSRRARRTRSMSTAHNVGNGYSSGGYGQGGGMYDGKVGTLGAGIRSQPSFTANSVEGGAPGSTGARSIGGRPTSGNNLPLTSPPMGASDSLSMGANSPLMGAGAAGVGAGGLTSPEGEAPPGDGAGGDLVYRAKALYAYTASPDDPNELSFSKGEVLDIIDKQGKWWQAKKSDGRVGIAPSNYLQII